MKKIIALMGILALVALIYGCSSSTSTTTTQVSGNAAVDSIGDDLNDVDAVNNDLNSDDLNNVSDELDQVNW